MINIRVAQDLNGQNMILKLFNKIILPFSTLLCLLKYNGIWGVKMHLAQSNVPNPRILDIYDAYLGKYYGSWIGYNAQFAGTPCFPHGFYGVFISGGAKLGKNTVIFQHVTIGSNTLNNSKKAGSPIIGDNVYIGAGAKIIGKIVIGDNCRIGANTVVSQDMPPHSVAVQSPTLIIQKANLDNRYYSYRGGRWVYFYDGDWIECTDKKS